MYVHCLPLVDDVIDEVYYMELLVISNPRTVQCSIVCIHTTEYECVCCDLLSQEVFCNLSTLVRLVGVRKYPTLPRLRQRKKVFVCTVCVYYLCVCDCIIVLTAIESLVHDSINLFDTDPNSISTGSVTPYVSISFCSSRRTCSSWWVGPVGGAWVVGGGAWGCHGGLLGATDCWEELGAGPAEGGRRGRGGMFGGKGNPGGGGPPLKRGPGGKGGGMLGGTS